MKKFLCSIAAVGLIALCSVATAQPPRDNEGPPPGGPEGGRGGGRPMPRPWEPGKVMPPPVMHALQLTEDQQKQVAELEKEVRQRLMKILTPEQKEKLKSLRPMGPPNGENQGQRRRGRRPGPPQDGPPGGGPPEGGPPRGEPSPNNN